MILSAEIGLAYYRVLTPGGNTDRSVLNGRLVSLWQIMLTPTDDLSTPLGANPMRQNGLVEKHNAVVCSTVSVR